MAIFRFPKRKLRGLIEQGEYTQAITYGKSLEARFSGDHDYLFIMGSIFYIVEDAQKALDYFDRALAIDADVETLHLKANIHLHLKENDIALQCCKKILEKDPDHKEARQIINVLESD